MTNTEYWTVKFRVPPSNEIANADYGIIEVVEQGIRHWADQSITDMLHWQVLKKEVVIEE